MNANENKSFMMRVATLVVDKRNIFFFIFLISALFCAVSRGWVQVCNDITRYLPEDTETRQGIDLMGREFTTFATAKVMVTNVTYDQAEALYDSLLETEGVKSIDFDRTSKHFTDAAALFSVTFDGGDDDEVSIRALESIKEELAAYDLYIDSQVGNPLEEIINSEMLIVDIIAVIIVVGVLLFTSKTYAEIPVLLLTFGAAAVLNMGTNFMMGEISFVTNSIAIVLQLALAVDYAIILCNRYMEEHESKPPRDAAIIALSKAIPEISASSLTTISGLLAMCLMEFRLGYDMGSVLIKAILLSLISVFLLMPGLLVIFSSWIDKTHHKSFVPKINVLGRAVYATRFVMPFIFIAVVIAAFTFSHRANYVYSQSSISSIRKNEAQISQALINDTFGRTNQLAIIVPAGDYKKEAKVLDEISQLEHVESALGLANIDALDGYVLTSELDPRSFSELADLDYEVASVLYAGYAMAQDDYGQVITNLENYSVPLIDMFGYLFEKRVEVTLDLPQETTDLLDDLEVQLNDAKLQLNNGTWTRLVLELDLPIEGDESYEYLDIIRGIVARYYTVHYLVGDTTSCSDLRRSFENDNILISILTVVFVVLVLLLTFKSAGLPILLIAIIQGSIWCNFSSPYLTDHNLFFMTYLIISSIQMGANIDYAIVISSRYMELKEELPLKEAMTETLNHAFPTIITSGTMLASAGFIIGFLTSNETISSIGIYLGIGTSISIFLVMCVLPQILLLGDILIRKTSFSIGHGPAPVSRSGLIRIDGKVKGNINGLIIAEVHGYFRGDLNATVDIGNVRDIEDGQLSLLLESKEEHE